MKFLWLCKLLDSNTFNPPFVALKFINARAPVSYDIITIPTFEAYIPFIATLLVVSY
jgi:hypothetical protein